MPVGSRSSVWKSKLLQQSRAGSSRRRRPRTARCRAAPPRLAVRRQHGHDVLQEVQLLVRRGDEEVLAVIILALAVDLAIVADDAVALLLAEGRIGEDHVITSCRPRRAAHPCASTIESTPLMPCRYRFMAREAHDLRHDVDAGELVPQRLIDSAVSRLRVFASCAPRRRAESPPVPQAGSCTVSCGSRIDDLDHRLDQRARREVLPAPDFTSSALRSSRPS